MNEAELLLVVDLTAGIPANIQQIEMLYKKMTIFKSLFQSYELEVLPSELLGLHPLVSAVLLTNRKSSNRNLTVAFQARLAIKTANVLWDRLSLVYCFKYVRTLGIEIHTRS